MKRNLQANDVRSKSAKRKRTKTTSYYGLQFESTSTPNRKEAMKVLHEKNFPLRMPEKLSEKPGLGSRNLKKNPRRSQSVEAQETDSESEYLYTVLRDDTCQGDSGARGTSRQRLIKRDKSTRKTKEREQAAEAPDIWEAVQKEMKMPTYPIKSLSPDLHPSPRPSCVRQEVILLPDGTPACLLIVTDKPSEDDAKSVKTFGNTLARELTSVLQREMSDPICIVPVFVERQQLRDISTIMEKTLTRAERLVPFGRWLMTPAKKESLENALQSCGIFRNKLMQ